MAPNERIARMTNELTAYELVIDTADGRRLLLSYSERRTRGCVIATMRRYGVALVPLIDDVDADWNRVEMAFVSRCWRIGYSGRTQRQAILDGELPRVSR